MYSVKLPQGTNPTFSAVEVSTALNVSNVVSASDRFSPGVSIRILESYCHTVARNKATDSGVSGDICFITDEPFVLALSLAVTVDISQ